MNNCSKCGNPLQQGQTTCPICGTSINIVPVTNNVETQVNPVEVTPVGDSNIQAQPAVVQTAQPVQPVVEPIQPAAPVAEAAPAAAPTPVVAEVVQPAPAPVAEAQAPTQPVVEAQPVAAPQVEVQPVAQPVAEPAPVAQPQVVEATPVVEAAPAPQPTLTNVVDAMSVPNLEQLEAKMDENITKPTKVKQKPKMALVAAIAAIVVIAGSALAITLRGGQSLKPGANAINDPQLSKTKIQSNGYKFEMPDSWYILENGKDVYVNNDSESIMIKFFNMKTAYDTLSASQIESYFNTSDKYKDVKIESLTLDSNKKAVKVYAKYKEDDNTSFVEYYYIEGNTELTYGLSIAYNDEQSYNDNAELVKGIINTLSYSNDTIKTLNNVSKYSQVFSAGEKIFNDYYYGISDPRDTYTSSEENTETEIEDTNKDLEENNNDYSTSEDYLDNGTTNDEMSTIIE